MFKKIIKRFLVPSTLTGRFALMGALAGVLMASVYIILTAYMDFPLGFFAGVGIVIVAALPGAIIAVLIHGLMKLLTKKAISGLIGLVTGFIIIFSLLGYPLIFALIIALTIVPFLSILFVLVARILRKEMSRLNKYATWFMLTIIIGVGISFTIWYNHEGTDTHLAYSHLSNTANQPALDLPDPSEHGPYQVSTFYYGSGTDIRRWEFGEGVNIKTNSVDMTPFLPELSAFRLNLRQKYWGFNLSNSPVNGRVWYPEGDGQFPLVLIVHGNHEMTKYSDQGYEYLGELLASRGYIVVSVDQNFFNGSFYAGDLTNQANVARGLMLLEHLKVWREWQLDETNPFYAKVDMSNIALIGHSRGGEAVAIAAALNNETHFPDNANILFDYGFDIKSVVAIAPVDASYTPAGRSIQLEDVDYLLLHGAHDGDVAVLMGNRQYQETTFSGKDYNFKSVLYIYQANHGQFNTDWGRRDMHLPLGKILNIKALMPAEEQRQIAKVYISAFLDASIKNEQAYLPLFQNYQAGSAWLPDTLTISRFQDSTFTVISDYEEDIDPISTTVKGAEQQGIHFEAWREGPLYFREESMKQSNNVVFLNWDQEENDVKIPSYNILIPQETVSEWELTDHDVLTFSMLDMSQGMHPFGDVTIQMKTSDDHISSILLSDVATIMPPFEINFTKLGFIEGLFVNPVEPVLQNYEIPLKRFYEMDLEAGTFEFLEIRFIFEHALKGEVALDDIGFRRSMKLTE